MPARKFWNSCAPKRPLLLTSYGFSLPAGSVHELGGVLVDSASRAIVSTL